MTLLFYYIYYKIQSEENLFWKVQENLLSIISNKSLIGMSSYKNRLILSRIQEQLNFMVNKSWEYAPDLFTQIYRYIYIENK